MVWGIRRARRSRFRSADGQRADPHGVFGITFTDRLVRVRPGHRTGRGSSSRMAAHGDMASGAPARRMVRRLPSHSARRRRRRAGSTRRARARRLTPVRSPGPTGRCDPWGAIARRRILTWGQALAPASRTFHSALNPAGTRCRQCRIISPPRSPCGRRRTGYGSIVTAWSRGTVISIGPGADGMLWDRGRTTGQAGPV